MIDFLCHLIVFIGLPVVVVWGVEHFLGWVVNTHHIHGRYALVWYVVYRAWPGEIEGRYLRGIGWGRYKEPPRGVHQASTEISRNSIIEMAEARVARRRSEAQSLSRQNTGWGPNQYRMVDINRLTLGRHEWCGKVIRQIDFRPHSNLYRLLLEGGETVDVDPRDLQNEDLIRSLYVPRQYRVDHPRDIL